jgi:hypothetical protein
VNVKFQMFCFDTNSSSHASHSVNEIFFPDYVSKKNQRYIEANNCQKPKARIFYLKKHINKTNQINKLGF